MVEDALARIIHEEVRAYLNAPGLMLEGWCDDCDEMRYFRRSDVVGECPGWWELDGDEREVFLSAARVVLDRMKSPQLPPPPPEYGDPVG